LTRGESINGEVSKEKQMNGLVVGATTPVVTAVFKAMRDGLLALSNNLRNSAVCSKHAADATASYAYTQVV